MVLVYRSMTAEPNYDWVLLACIFFRYKGRFYNDGWGLTASSRRSVCWAQCEKYHMKKQRSAAWRSKHLSPLFRFAVFHATPNWLNCRLKEARGLSIRKRRQRPYHVILKQKCVMCTENPHLMRFWCGNALFKSLRRYVDETLVCTWFVSSQTLNCFSLYLALVFS